MSDEEPRILTTNNYELIKIEKELEDIKNSEERVPTNPERIVKLPGIEWIVSNFSMNRLKTLRILSMTAFVFKPLSLLLGEIMGDYQGRDSAIKIDHAFILIGWSLMIVLEGFFIWYLSRKDNLNSDIIAYAIGFRLIPASFLEIIYLLIRNYSDDLLFDLVCTALLLILFGLILYVNIRAKTEKENEVKFSEYLTVHSRLSLLNGWLIILFLQRVFFCLSHSEEYDGKEQLFIYWNIKGWAMLFLCLTTAISCMLATKYKEVYIGYSVSYGLFGVFVEKISCEEDCSEPMQIISGTFAALVLIITLISHFANRIKICKFAKVGHQSDAP